MKYKIHCCILLSHLEDNVPDLAVSLEKLLDVPLSAVVGDVADVNFVISHCDLRVGQVSLSCEERKLNAKLVMKGIDLAV